MALLDTCKIHTSVIEFLIRECGHIGNIHKKLINFERKSLAQQYVMLVNLVAILVRNGS